MKKMEPPFLYSKDSQELNQEGESAIVEVGRIG